ncbi:MAG: adenylate/guanylate cyclase domain-containing protein [Cyanobacteriota bacterium]|nr:adenylate/guanylate cyclase domain-containing protein [Cyanobacteriota bacterium]
MARRPPRELSRQQPGPSRRARLAAGLLLLWVGLSAGWPGPRWQVAERGLEDQLLRLSGPQQPPGGVALVAIDDASLQQGDWYERNRGLPEWAQGLGSLPWPRAAYAMLIERLLAAGARAVAVNVVFEGASARGPADDAALAATLRRHRGRVALAAEMQEGEDQQAAGALSLLRPDDALVEAIGGPSALGITNLLLPRPGERLLHPDAYTAALKRSSADSDNIASLSTALLQRGGRLGSSGRDPRSALRVYGGEGSLERISAWEVLDPERWRRHPRRAALAGRVVLVGPVQQADGGGYLTAFGPLSGLELLGTATANSLAGDGLLPWPADPPGRALLAMLPLLIALAAGRRLRSIQARLTLLSVLLTLVLAAGLVVLQRGNRWLPLLAPMTGLGGLALLYGGQAYLREEGERRRLRRTFERYVAPDVVAEILSDPGAAEGILRGRRLEVTVLMSDIRGFTGLTRARSEAGESELHVRQLNEYLAAMVEEVIRHGGTIDKFIGDAVMAVFGSPVSRGQAEEACQALRCALAMRRALAALNARWRQQGLTELDNGVGLASGPVMAGQIGSPRRMEFTVIGDTVNLAARLEASTRHQPAAVVCDASTAQLAAQDPELAVESLGSAELKGFGSVQLFTATCSAPSAEPGRDAALPARA